MPLIQGTNTNIGTRLQRGVSYFAFAMLFHAVIDFLLQRDCIA